MYTYIYIYVYIYVYIYIDRYMYMYIYMYICITSYQLFWSMIQLISRNQRAVSPEAQPRVIQPSDCEI